MPGFKRSLAVVIGINHYVNGIAELKTAANNANKLALILEENYQYQVLRLLDEDATKPEFFPHIYSSFGSRLDFLVSKTAGAS